MTRTPLLVLPRCVATAAAVAALGGCASTPIIPSAVPIPPRVSLDSEALAVHVLNRLSFGPRPGDVERVVRMGLDRWIDEQLRPESIDDRSAAIALRGCAIWTDPVAAVAAQLAGPSTSRLPDNSGTRMTIIVVPAFLRVATRDSARRDERLGPLLLDNGQLFAGRLTRVEASDQQLLEVMTDFWENHFSVSAAKVLTRGSIVEWDRATIRPHALGRFRDLLGAVAKSPVMLHYLDNAQSSARALNENYGRELLELHTLGVDGGYTQADVVDVSRSFTGWAHTMIGSDGKVRLSGAASPAVFRFDAARHDSGVKVVLGHSLAAGRGMADGDEVLDILARHPSTARFIARKLTVRFVSDTPPASLVERAAAIYLRTGGDIREVVRTIVRSSEFRSEHVVRAKVKTPVELVLSMRRALAAPVDTAAEMIDFLVELEQAPFGHATPEGWPETGLRWMNVGAMRVRVELANRIANGAVPSIPLEAWPEWKVLSAAPFDDQVAGVIRSLLGNRVSTRTRSTMLAVRPTDRERGTVEARPALLRDLVALALASPEFQTR